MDVAQLERCGLDLQTLFAERPETPVIFTAKCPKVAAAVAAMKAGAVDFLPEPPEESLLRTAIQVALDGSRSQLARGAEVRELAQRYESLSGREREVMARVILGRMNKLIADELGISVITVKAHRGKVMRKMKAASLPDLVNMATRLAREGAGLPDETDQSGRARPRVPGCSACEGCFCFMAFPRAGRCEPACPRREWPWQSASGASCGRL